MYILYRCEIHKIVSNYVYVLYNLLLPSSIFEHYYQLPKMYRKPYPKTNL